MKNKIALGIVAGSCVLMSSTTYAEPEVNLRAGFVYTDSELELDADDNSFDDKDSDSYLVTDLNGTLSLDDKFINLEVKTTRLTGGAFDDDDMDAFSLSGGLRLDQQSTFFAGIKRIDWEDAVTSQGFFAGYAYLIPLDNSAISLSGAIGLMKAELDGIKTDSDNTLGYNFKASYLYPLSDVWTLSGDITTYSYTYNFKNNGAELDVTESNFGVGVTFAYSFK